MTPRVFAGFGSLLCAAAFAACAAPGGAPGSSSQSYAVRTGGAPATVHLYVSDRGTKAVLRYPMTNGIPAETPDAVVSGFMDPRGIAIGPDRRLYVVDAALKVVAIYSPGPSSTAKPIRTLPIKHQYGMGTVGVDPKGNLYVAYTLNCTTDGFSCGYTDVYSSFDSGSKFIKTLNFGGGPGSTVIRSLAWNRAGTLVEESGGQTVVVYYDPLRDMGNNYPIFCGSVDSWGVTWGAGNEVFETDLGGNAQQPPAVDVIPDYLKGRINNCPSFYTITSATVPLSIPRTITTNGQYVYVTREYDAHLKSGVVFVFDPAKQGPQKPIATIQGPSSGLVAPAGIAIGP